MNEYDEKPSVGEIRLILEALHTLLPVMNDQERSMIRTAIYLACERMEKEEACENQL